MTCLSSLQLPVIIAVTCSCETLGAFSCGSCGEAILRARLLPLMTRRARLQQLAQSRYWSMSPPPNEIRRHNNNSQHQQLQCQPAHHDPCEQDEPGSILDTCTWSEAQYQALLWMVPESNRMHHQVVLEGDHSEYDIYLAHLEYMRSYPGAAFLEMRLGPHHISHHVEHWTNAGLTAAAARELVQFFVRTYFTPDRAEATLLQMKTFDMCLESAHKALSLCCELLIFPPQTLHSRLENVWSLTAMSHSQASSMIRNHVCCLTFSNSTISDSVKSLAGELASPCLPEREIPCLSTLIEWQLVTCRMGSCSWCQTINNFRSSSLADRGCVIGMSCILIESNYCSISHVFLLIKLGRPTKPYGKTANCQRCNYCMTNDTHEQ